MSLARVVEVNLLVESQVCSLNGNEKKKKNRSQMKVNLKTNLNCKIWRFWTQNLKIITLKTSQLVILKMLLSKKMNLQKVQKSLKNFVCIKNKTGQNLFQSNLALLNLSRILL